MSSVCVLIEINKCAVTECLKLSHENWPWPVFTELGFLKLTASATNFTFECFLNGPIGRKLGHFCRDLVGQASALFTNFLQTGLGVPGWRI